MEIGRDVLDEVIWDAEIDEDNLYLGYSGRAMYGKKCFGIVGNYDAYGKFLVQLSREFPDIAWELAQNVQVDSMGRDLIFYFPSYTVVDSTDEENNE